ncbi:MAG TPA: hypothetical protein VK455_04130 [Thermoplasmata archaeon]|nr:hypothetical protein [Thermoplasmata archaeon]
MGEPPGPTAPPYRLLRREPSRPHTSVLLVLLSGIFSFIEAFVDLGSGVHFSGLSLSSLSGDSSWLGGANILFGTLILFLALQLHQTRWYHRMIGGLVAILAMCSLLVGGGFLFGSALGIGGGVLAIAWTPTPPFYLAPQDESMCPRCGAVVASTDRNCPTCGWAT